MSTPTEMNPTAEMSPRTKARAAGVFYLLTIVTGLFAQGFVSERLIVPTSASVTAANILAHESLFRLSFAVYLVEMSCQIVMIVLLYDLLKPAGRSISRLAAIFGLTGCGIKILSRLFYYAPLLMVGREHYLGAFNTEQVQALALVFLKVNDAGAGIALVFFGIYAFIKGWLVLRSTFLPRALGVLSMIGGAGWLAFLSPPFGQQVFPVIAVVGLLGALAFIIWLIVVGVDEQRWREQVRAEMTSVWR
jgi:Domain of unknown function (DUF4386)